MAYNFTNLTVRLAILIGLFIAGFALGSVHTEHNLNVIKDTVRLPRPVIYTETTRDTLAIDSLQLLLNRARAISARSSSKLALYQDSTEQLKTQVSALTMESWRSDIASLNLPRQEVVYKTSQYRAKVSGVVAPSLDMLEIYPTKVIDQRKFTVGLLSGVRSDLKQWHLYAGAYVDYKLDDRSTLGISYNSSREWEIRIRHELFSW